MVPLIYVLNSLFSLFRDNSVFGIYRGKRHFTDNNRIIHALY